MNHFFTLLFAASCLTAVGQVPGYVPTDGLVSYFTFSGSFDELSGSNLHLEADGQISFDEGHFGDFGQAARFDFPSSLVLVSDLCVMTNEVSMSAWINAESTAQSRIFTQWYNGTNQQYSMLLSSDSEGVRPYFLGTGTQGNMEPSDPNVGPVVSGLGEWFHLSMVYDGSDLVFYANGEVVYEQQIGYGFASATQNPFVKLGQKTDGQEQFVGRVDELIIHDRALSQDEVAAIYNAPTPVAGCLDSEACNFDTEATLDDGSCHFNCQFCLTGTVWSEELGGCIGDGSGDINLDGCVQLNDLLDLLSAYGDCGAEESAWQCGDSLEYQGYDYETVQIGEQCWFAENLRAENYRNGDAIPANLSDDDWSSTTYGGVAVYGEDEGCNSESPDFDACDPSQSFEAYGRLYNWFAVNDERSLCPVDWHVPTDGEWTLLTDYLGDLSVVGDMMKTTSGWIGNGTNSSGFSGLPGGSRHYHNGGFNNAGYGADWWSTTPNGPEAWYRHINQLPEVNRFTWGKRGGFSVRCIKD